MTNQMKSPISEVQIVPIKPRDGLVGFASFVFYKSIFLGGIGIYTRPEGGYRLCYPIRKLTNKGVNIFYPINKEVGKDIENAIVNKFEEVVNKDDRYSSYDF